MASWGITITAIASVPSSARAVWAQCIAYDNVLARDVAIQALRVETVVAELLADDNAGRLDVRGERDPWNSNPRA